MSATVLVLTRTGDPTETDRSERLGGLGGEDGDAMSTTKLTTALSLPSPGVGPGGLSLGHGGTVHRGAGETHYGTARERGLASETADDVALEQAAAVASGLGAHVLTVRHLSTAFPLETMLRHHDQLSLPARRAVTFVGRSRLDAPSHRLESLTLLRIAEKAGRLGACASSEVRKAIGEAATALLIAESTSGAASDAVLVIQSRATAGQRSVKRMAAHVPT